MSVSLKQKQKGFTIVELLIVIVVIGILAAITTMVYTTVQNRTNDTAVQSDLRAFGNVMSQQLSRNSSYPLNPTLAMGIKFTKGSYLLGINNLYYCVNSTGSQFAITGKSKSGNAYTYRSNSGLSAFTATFNGTLACTDAGLVASDWRDTGYSTSWAAWVN